MTINMNIREFITKLQNLPEDKKKIILWAIVVFVALILCFIWFKISVVRFARIEESMKKTDIPLVNSNLDNFNTEENK